MTHICEYCQSTFKAKSGLIRHQKTAKKCLDRRGIKPKYHNCNCGKEYTRLHDLQQHREICIKSANMNNDWMAQQVMNMVKEFQKQNGDLQKQLLDLSTTNVTNNGSGNVVLNNLQPISDQEVEEQAAINLTLKHIFDGAKGYADFANGYPFKDRLLCTDKSRKKLRYKDDTGEVEDSGGSKLTQRFFQAIAPRNEELINAEYSALHEQVAQIAANGTVHNSNFTELAMKATNLQGLHVQCRQAAQGEENDLTKEFIKQLSKMIT